MNTVANSDARNKEILADTDTDTVTWNTVILPTYRDIHRLYQLEILSAKSQQWLGLLVPLNMQTTWNTELTSVYLSKNKESDDVGLNVETHIKDALQYQCVM